MKQAKITLAIFLMVLCILMALRPSPSKVPMQSHADVVMMGDSITFRLGERHTLPQGWAVKAKPGQCARDMIEWVDEVKAMTPNRVYLLAGINDLCEGRMGNTGAPASPKEVALRIEKIVHSLAPIPVTVQSIMLTRTTTGTNTEHWLNPLVMQTNSLLKEQNGALYMDLNETLCPHNVMPADYTDDGIHPNTKGLAAWRAMFK